MLRPLLVAALALSASPAAACRVPHIHLFEPAPDGYQAVVIARVTHIGKPARPDLGSAGRAVSAKVEHVVEGDPGGTEFAFTKGGEPCSLPGAPAKLGELYVLYLRKTEVGIVVQEATPLQGWGEIDPKRAWKYAASTW
jgi:hypothetical protein